MYSIVLFPLTIVIYGERPRLSQNIVNVNFFPRRFFSQTPPKYIRAVIYCLIVCVYVYIAYFVVLDTFYIGKPIGIVVLRFVYIVEFVSFAFFLFSFDKICAAILVIWKLSGSKRYNTNIRDNKVYRSRLWPVYCLKFPPEWFAKALRLPFSLYLASSFFFLHLFPSKRSAFFRTRKLRFLFAVQQ